MTDEDRRVATLAALFAPAAAGALLARLATPGAADTAAHSVRLAAAARRDRLLALTAVLAPDDRAGDAAAEATAALERGPVAAVVRALAGGGAPAAPGRILPRLCRERLGR